MKTVHDRWKVTTSYVTFKKNIKNLILNNRRKLLKTRVKPRYTSKSFKYWNVFFACILSFIGGRRLFIKAASLLTSKSSLNPCIARGEECCYFGKVGFLTHKFSFNFLACPNRPQSSKKRCAACGERGERKTTGSKSGFQLYYASRNKVKIRLLIKE